MDTAYTHTTTIVPMVACPHCWIVLSKDVLNKIFDIKEGGNMWFNCPVCEKVSKYER